MKPASEKMKKKINDTKNQKLKFNNVTVTAREESNLENIKKLLIDQIFSTVKWRESIIYMSDKGVKNFIELGPGKALSGMVKRTLKNANTFSINTITDIKNLKDEFKNKKIPHYWSNRWHR